MKFSIDPDGFTLGDMEDFEEVTGKTLQSALKPVPIFDEETGERAKDEKGRPLSAADVTAKVLTALVWLSARADNPDLTLADARKIKVTELVFEDSEDDSEGNG